VDVDELAALTADPLQVVGWQFYFDEGTRATAKELGLRTVEFYGLGRGGVLGDVDAQRVEEVFAFFDPSAVERFWTSAKSKADPVATAERYLRSAYDYADRTFGGVDRAVLSGFAAAARKVAEATAPGLAPLMDGYRRFAAPEEPARAAYLGAILLRELRGGLHVNAVAEVGLETRDAAYLEDPGLFASHGYDESAAPEVTDELREMKARAEELTNAAVAASLKVLDETERDALAAGALALLAAASDPVPVAR
jgi:hypothetical protein